MSAQGGTLAKRGAVHLPIWPVAALLGAAMVAVIGLSILSAPETGVVTSVSDAQRIANSNAAVREQGAVLPIERPLGNPWQAQANAYVASLESMATTTWPAMQAQADAYVASLVAMGSRPFPVGLENPGAYAPPATAYVSGLENPGAYLGDGQSVSTPKVDRPEPIVIDGEVCHQCL
jgi:hypothetical protein